MPREETVAGSTLGRGNPHCRTHADLYAPAARRQIVAACREFLASNRLTTSELLHVPAHQQRFLNAGQLYQQLVQRVAVQQIEGSDTPVQARMRELYAIIDAAIKATAAHAAIMPTPPEDPAAIIDHLAALAGTDNEVPGFAEEAALAVHLARFATWPDKLTATIELASRAVGMPVFAQLDRLLGEILQLGGASGVLFPEMTSPATLIEAAVDWLSGMWKDESVTPAGRLAALAKRGAMPQTRAAFASLLRTLLARPAPLTSKAPAEELAALTVLLGCLRGASADYGGEATLEPLAKRFDRLLTAEGLNGLLKGQPNAGQRLIWLVELHGALAGVRNQANVASLINHQLQNARALEVMLREPSPALTKLRQLAQLHAAIAKAGFSANIRDKLARPVEQAHGELVRQSQLLERIEKGGTMTARAIKLIELCSSDIMIPDANLTAARQRLARCLQDGSFMAGYLGDVDGEAKTLKLAQLRSKLSSIGMNVELQPG
jgi:hypothetical protein